MKGGYEMKIDLKDMVGGALLERLEKEESDV